MKCIIQIDEFGNPIFHPHILDAFIKAYPDKDISSDEPPEGWAWFTRINPLSFSANTIITATQIIDRRYVKTPDGTGFQDDFYVRDLTSDEINEKIEILKANPPFPSWTLETDTYYYLPPVSKPKPYGYFTWQEETKSWIIPKKDSNNIMVPPTPDKIPTGFTPESALQKEQELMETILKTANNSNIITANT